MKRLLFFLIICSLCFGGTIKKPKDKKMANNFLTFNGTTGYITVPDDPALDVGTGDFSICFWAKDIFASTCTIITKRQSGTLTGYTVGYTTATDKIQLTLMEVIAGGTIVVPLSVSEGVSGWQHIAFSCDRDGNGIPYLNGVAQTAIDISAHGYTLNTSESMLIGYNGTANFVSGSLDDVRLYKVALSASEISAVYNSGAGRKYTGSSSEGGDALAFNFDEGTGNPVSMGTAALTGTITGGVTWNAGGTPFYVKQDLYVFLPNHGYSNGDSVFVSWLNGIYYILNVSQNAFQLSTVAGGDPIQYDTDITTGYVREIDTATGLTTISGLNYLEGQTVYTVAEGEWLGSFVVANGNVTLTRDIYTYQVGLPYAMKNRTMRLELPNVQGLQGRIKRIHEITVRAYRSIGGQVGQEYNGTEYLNDMNAVYSNQSKDYRVTTDGGFSTEGYVIVRSNDPFPFTILALVLSFSADEP